MDHADEANRPRESLRPSPEVISRRLDRAGVLVHLSTNRIFELNETGIRIWELLAEGRDRQSLIDHLVREFDVDAERAAREVSDLLHQLQQEGLIGS